MRGRYPDCPDEVSSGYAGGRRQVIGCRWGTRFWVDPANEMSCIFMVQAVPFAFVSAAEEFWSLVCQATTD